MPESLKRMLAENAVYLIKAGRIKLEDVSLEFRDLVEELLGPNNVVS